MERIPPRPRGSSSGGGSLKKILIAAAALVLLAGGGYAGYTFLWPMLTGSGAEPSTPPTQGPTATTQPSQPQANNPTQKAPSGPSATSEPTNQQQPGTTPPSGPTTQPGQPTSAEPPPSTGQPTSQPSPPPKQAPKASPPATQARPKATPPPPKQPTPTPQKQQTPPAARPGTTPPPSTATTGSSLSRSYELLKSGNLDEAAAGYLQHLRANAKDKFTIPVGVYCDSANASRAFKNSGDSNRIIVLPYRYKGRSCYRVYWGLFDSQEEAISGTSSVPSAIRAPGSTPVPTSKLIH